MTRHIFIAMCTAVAVLMLAGCASKEKNTAMTRRVQAMKAHYNTYFNGSEAFKEGRQSQEQGNKDNFTEIIPFYILGNKSTVSMGSNNFDRAVEKCQKTIKQHSITARPKWSKSRAKKPKEKIWLSQKEYNPFLWRAWFLMGEAQMSKGDYMEAASTYAYIQRLYFSKPDLVARARVMEARCYDALDWTYDAEDLLRRAQLDSFPDNLQGLKAGVIADMQLKQGQYEAAIPNVEAALKAEKRSLQKTRLLFLLGQLYSKTGDVQKAYKYFGKVIRRNPPFDIEFNARIKQTEVMSKGRSRQMIRKLQSMAANPKNKDYLDQVYYAIGNIYLASGDTTRAVWAYKDGVEKSTRNGLEKGVVALHLGQLYWDMEKFVDAQKMYSTALGLMDKDSEGYEDVDQRSRILDELQPSAEAVELQDSLQMMASLDSITRMKKINIVIEELKKKEKEDEAAQAAQQQSQQNQQGNQGGRSQQGTNRPGQSQQSVWYFYNATAVAAGKTDFARKWGNRQLADNWRRENKTVLADLNSDSNNAANDSIRAAQDSIAAVQDSIAAARKKMSKTERRAQEDAERAEEYANDPHRPEYYLKDIPFTDEQMEASNAALVDGLYGSAVIFKDRMENFELAERTFSRIMNDFPEFDKMDEVLYNMYQLYSRMGNAEYAEAYRTKLIAEHPDNAHAKQVADPLFVFKGLHGKAIEDSIYTVTYDAFLQGDYATAISNSEYVEKEYPDGANRPRFMFVEAMSRLEMGERTRFLSDLKKLVEKYPQAPISELAGMYVKGLNEGRLLASGKFEMGSIWERRGGMMGSADSIAADTTFISDRNCNFVFAIAYERDSIDQNQLLFELARYNFTTFAVRNFDIAIVPGDGIDMMQVRSFLNYDEAYIYLHRLLNNEDMAYKLQGLKCFIISEDNLKKLMHGLSFADYFDFYDEHFDRIGKLKISPDEPTLLDEPEELPQRDEDEDDEDDFGDDDNFIF